LLSVSSKPLYILINEYKTITLLKCRKEKKMDNEEIGLEDLLKIDRSMGERRSHQVVGVILIIGLVLFAIYWDEIRVIFGW